MRRLIGGLSLLALLAASPARTATDPPAPSTPVDALALLKWCWENRDATRYHELFTQDFQYVFANGDPAGIPYRTSPWVRLDELVSATNLFGASTTRAPASSVTMTYTGGPFLQPVPWGIGYPWHQRFVAQWTLDVACTDGSTLYAGGQSVWSLVRGDSALIPQDLKDRGFLPDSGRWYIQRWAEEMNSPPVVVAPSEVRGMVLAPITVLVTARDPDGEPIASLTAESGLDASFTPSADNTAGTFFWTPTRLDLGLHSVIFKASNSLTGSATTTINVLATTPIASLIVTPLSGTAPLNVTADASHSSDAGGPIASYQFDFGDGTVVGPQMSPVATHTYGAGTWTATVRVVNSYHAAATASATITVVNGVPVDSVTVTPASTTVQAGSTVQLTATPLSAGGTPLTGRTVTWSSDNTALATVNGSGRVTGVAVGGPVTITAACEGKTGTAAITVTAAPDPVSLLPNLVTNPSFEVDTKGWGAFAGSTIERVLGGHDGLYALQMTGSESIVWGFGVNDSPDWVHRTTMAGRRYRYSAWVRSEASHGTARIRVREYFLATAALLGQISSLGVRLTPAWQKVEVDYTSLSTGSSLDFQVKDSAVVPFEVFLTDDISIRDITGVAGLAPANGVVESEPDDAVQPLQSAIYPSPVETQGVLAFATSRPGALRVDLLDLAGRQVRRIDDEIDSPSGMHVLTIDGIRDDGQRMRPGVYFYRILADEGRVTGRFVLLR